MGKASRARAPPPAPLLTRDGELSAPFADVLRAVFARFDADGDGVLCDGELNAFAAACNDGEPFSPDELEEIKARRERVIQHHARRPAHAPTAHTTLHHV